VSDSNLYASVIALVMDVDGVLTDGTFLWSDTGGESKRFSFEDVMGLSRARRAGLKLGLISGEDSGLVDRFAAKVGIPSVAKGCKEKAAALRDFAEKNSTSLAQTAYIGDDVNDLSALAIAGLSVAPANARPEVKAVVQLVLQRSGGQGAVRELVELILTARQRAGVKAAL
jgi:3-deoxy-D-manno-octulosonate 8-phosphate phosphatase (KDO 8-P phosphatase)